MYAVGRECADFVKELSTCLHPKTDRDKKMNGRQPDELGTVHEQQK